MAEDTKAAPAVTPAPAPARAPISPTNQALQEQGGGAGQKDFDPGLKGPLNPNPTPMGAAPTKKFPASSSLITNPKPAEEYEAEQNPEDLELPESTRAEMEAGKKALERNKPVSVARDRAAVQTPRDSDGTPLQNPKV